jgi:hypothetical protein
MAPGEACAASINWPGAYASEASQREFRIMQNWPEIHMRNQNNHQLPRPQSAQKPPISTSAMAFAQKVAAEFEKLETGYRNGLYNFFGKALISYREFLDDPAGYKELLDHENIAGIREKPDLETTSRLVLYYLTGARNKPERTTAGRYARVVDYLSQERVGGVAAAADHVRVLGGMNAVLKVARGREALKAAQETPRDDVQDLDQEDEPGEARSLALTSSDITDEIFDPEDDVSIRVGRETLERVLGPEIGTDDSFYLECRKIGPAGRDGIRIVGKLVDLEPA